MENEKDLEMTQYLKYDSSNKMLENLQYVIDSLKEKGYNPYDQIVGYLITGDPSYIPRYNDCRNILKKENREDIIKYCLISSLKKFENHE